LGDVVNNLHSLTATAVIAGTSAFLPQQNWSLTPAVSRRAMRDVLEVHATIGAVGSSALFK
jgi:hypothetical protein